MAEIHPIKTAAETALAEAYGAVRDALPGTDETRTVRDEAFSAFRDAGLPHRRVEDWKYTDLRGLMREARPLAPAPDSVALDKARHPSEVLADHAHLRLTLVDGSFAPSLSDVALMPAGVRVVSLAQALADGDAARRRSPGHARAGQCRALPQRGVHDGWGRPRGRRRRGRPPAGPAAERPYGRRRPGDLHAILDRARRGRLDDPRRHAMREPKPHPIRQMSRSRCILPPARGSIASACRPRA